MEIKRKEEITLVIAIIIGIIVLSFYLKNNAKLKQDKRNLIIAYQDTLVKYKEKDNSQTAKIGLLQDNNTNFILSMKNVSSDMKFLQEEIKKNKDLLKEVGNSIAVISANTTYTNSNITNITNNHSIIKGDTVYNYPEYTSSNKDTLWIKYKTIANRDSTQMFLKVKNKYSIIIGQEKFNWKHPFKITLIVKVNNQNPYTDVQELRAFQIKDNRPLKRVSLGGQIGYGITKSGLSPYIGIGVNFKIL